MGKERAKSILLKGGVSAMALTALVAGLAMPAYAQDASATDKAKDGDKSTEVVVVGVRRSLKTAQQIKRNADTVVDSIVATDLGAFPDKSVAEALQRVAGVTVSRFAATSDTAHFSAEPSGVLVRGLSQVRSEFNGRDTFSANSSRGLSWGDVSPELMARVDTYKNETASMIEGGIAGTVDLRTRLPFDSKGQQLAFSADVAYNDQSKQTTPDFSGIYSNRWDTKLGEFGLMLNGAYSYVVTNSQGAQFSRAGIYDASLFGGTAGDHDYIPNTLALHDNTYYRTRHGIAAAGQWQNHDHTMIATLQYNDTNYKNEWKEHIVTGSFASTWQNPVTTVFTDPTRVEPATGTSPFTFGSDGWFQTGTPSGLYFGNTAQNLGINESGQPIIAGCNNWSGPADDASCGRLASQVGTSTRYANTQEATQDTSFNFNWDVSDKLSLNFDVQYVHSTVDNYDMTADLDAFANVYLDTSGKYPTMAFSAPENVNESSGGLTNPANYRYNDLMDHAESSEGHELATRLDAEYRFGGDSWLDSVKVGARYSDREQTIRWTTYNWAGLSSVWSSGDAATDCWAITGKCYPQDIYENRSFGTTLLGQNNLLNENDFVFIKMDAIQDRAKFAQELGAATVGYGWTPLCDRSTDVSGTCFTQAELSTVSEKTTAAYAEFKFGDRDKTLFGKSYSGNFGLRWVQTEDTSDGYVQSPSGAWATTSIFSGSSYCGSSALSPLSQQLACYLPDPGYTNTGSSDPNPSRPASGPYFTTASNLIAAAAFSNGSGTPLVSSKTHIDFLPSFNFKINLNDQWLVRFAASRAMSRPDMGLLKNYVSISDPSIDLTCVNAPENCIKNSSGAVTDYIPKWTAQAGNAALKPITADQFDVSIEDYFSSVGSFTFDLFYKKFYNYIQTGKFVGTFTNNGVTENVAVTGPVNADGASVKGFEVAYQRFFDFLPSPWDGLGIQANYTHIHNTGVSNTNLTNVSGSGSATPTSSASGLGQDVDSINPHALEGLSNDAYNIVARYEKGAWAARLAYNWRSTYLVSSLDCCVGLPVWQKAQGILDGSISYRVNDNIEISLQASNILDGDTVLMQQVEGDTASTPNAKRVLMPDAWFTNDRRFQIGVRFKY